MRTSKTLEDLTLGDFVEELEYFIEMGANITIEPREARHLVALIRASREGRQNMG